jgi:hypothetical protein
MVREPERVGCCPLVIADLMVKTRECPTTNGDIVWVWASPVSSDTTLR